MQSKPPAPLTGLTILEMGQLLAGPFAATLLAWFGAEVIKIEPPGTGDALRSWRGMHEGTSLWWSIMGRNKKSVTLDLRTSRGQAIARRLAGGVDVLLENFKPGTLERWGLDYDTLKADHPGLILARVSGWGQSGPRSAEPGYASVAEGVGGLRYVTGHPDRPPVRSNLSLGDTLAGLHAALGVLTALYHRDRGGEGEGQVVDVAIYEAVFNMMESALPELDVLGEVRERQGSQAVRHRAVEHLPVPGREVRDHRRKRRQHLQAAHACGGAGRPRRRPPSRAQRRPRGPRAEDRSGAQRVDGRA